MKDRTLGRTGLTISRLALGCMSCGDPERRGRVLPEEQARPFFRRALNGGVHLFDTADTCSLGETLEAPYRPHAVRVFGAARRAR